MKRLILAFTLAIVFMAANAQSYSVRQQRNSGKDTVSVVINKESFQRHLDNSGRYLKKSALWNGVSWACAGASGIVFAASINSNNHKPFNIIGTTLAVAALCSQIATISFKGYAGNELQLSAAGITYKF